MKNLHAHRLIYCFNAFVGWDFPTLCRAWFWFQRGLGYAFTDGMGLRRQFATYQQNLSDQMGLIHSLSYILLNVTAYLLHLVLH
jgi:hypothetical protein